MAADFEDGSMGMDQATIDQELHIGTVRIVKRRTNTALDRALVRTGCKHKQTLDDNQAATDAECPFQEEIHAMNCSRAMGISTETEAVEAAHGLLAAHAHG